MKQIVEITSDPLQTMTIQGENGEQISFTLTYMPTQQGWYFDISYNDFILNGHKLNNHPNMLRQWKNIIPFGLACIVNDDWEPYFIDDFTNGRASLFLLNADDVSKIEKVILLQ